MIRSQLNLAHESFVIVQSDDDGVSFFPPKPRPSSTDGKQITDPALPRSNGPVNQLKSEDFTFVGGVYPSLAAANNAALALAAKKCECTVQGLTFAPLNATSASRVSSISSIAHMNSHSSGTAVSSVTASPNSGPTLNDARAQLVHQKSEDGRYLCRCRSSGEGEGKIVKLEVRKIEVRPLGSRMGWSFSDDDA